MLISRRALIKLLGCASAALSFRAPRVQGGEQGFAFNPEPPVIHAPDDPAAWPDFRRLLEEWRQRKHGELGYSDALYAREDFAWVPSSFACCFLMVCDELFYDHRADRYRVTEFLEHGRSEFGGFDSVVLWHAYPRLGLDERNQFDFYRDLPGGLARLRQAVDEFHRAGVKVFLDYNPWDEKTRREGRPDLDALAELVGVLNADGIFLDTMDRGAAEFRGKLDAVRQGVVLESEIALPLDRVADHHMSWAQWFGDSRAPGVLRNKWFERRHMQHQIDRWNRDHSGELHQAWMNGSGMMIWENVFGSWNGWCPRDRSLLRATLPIQRRFAWLFCGEDWTPLVPVTGDGVYGSRWQGRGLRLWTLVNRGSQRAEAAIPEFELSPGEGLWDLVRGEPLESARLLLPARGIGCILAGATGALGPEFPSFLQQQQALLRRAEESTNSPMLRARLRPARAAVAKSVPPGMAAIPAASLVQRVQFRVRECGFHDSTDDRMKGPSPPALHQPAWFDRPVELKPFAIDLVPVTNARYAEFLRGTGYVPREPRYFLKHWVDGAPPAGKEDHPVVYVDLDDARAYAAWAGKRLPTEEEWQFAAQGADGRRYPWGNEMRDGRCNSSREGGTSAVTAFPEGRSPFGVYDLCGNVWEWTESERSDGRTRFAILRGGSFYRRGGSDWYFDEGPQPASFAAKMLLCGPSLDRCANVGFRCAVSLA